MLQVYKNSIPVVSIILSTFNRADLIGRAIESVIKQSFSDWELIIVDDGSTDETFMVVNDYLRGRDNIRYLKHSNRHLPFSRNAGIQAAVGEYVAFLDSDDEYLPEHLELRVKYLKKNADVDLIHGGIIIVGEPFVPDKNNRSKKIHLSECVIGGTFFGKRYIFQSLRGFRDIAYSEDSDFIERASEIYTIRKVAFPTYVYHRETEKSICNTANTNDASVFGTHEPG